MSIPESAGDLAAGTKCRPTATMTFAACGTIDPSGSCLAFRGRTDPTSSAQGNSTGVFFSPKGDQSVSANNV